jgi:hypothetical protein
MRRAASREPQRSEGFFPAFFGLKGRFCQPRPKAWEYREKRQLTLKGSFTVRQVNSVERPFQGRCLDDNRPQAFGLG